MNGLNVEMSIPPKMRDLILEKLRETEKKENIQILFAIESGSRAWGFPSPDSDYDARFVYTRPVDWYLSIAPGRDVIELPIVGDLDINGWDIKKALGLLIKPNPVLLEWLSSPICYMWNEKLCARLIEFSKRVSHGPACTHHYLNLGESLYNESIVNRDEIKIKRYFYILRPALALRWLRMTPDQTPPMNFHELMAGTDLPAELLTILRDLLHQKARTKEMGTAKRIALLDQFVESEFHLAHGRVKDLRPEKSKLRDEADTLFRQILRRTLK